MRVKFIYGLVLLSTLSIFWLGAAYITAHRLVKLETLGKIDYGPLPNLIPDHYSFASLDHAFGPRLDLSRSDEFTKLEFENIILNSLPLAARENFKPYIAETLLLSVEYQIDPFWVIAIMMVESGFALKAESHKNARGLMQIQPETAEHLYQLMGKKFTDAEVATKLHESNNNIDVGIFYLKKLYQNFRFDYKLATIAYNIGPNKVKRRLEQKDDFKNFSYLVKVQHCYKLLENNFLLQLKALDDNSSQNLANIPYRNEFFSKYAVQSKFFL